MDYSNPAESEAGKLLPNTLGIESAWLGGYNKAKGFALEVGLWTITDDDKHDEVTLKCPINPNSTVGVSDKDEDTEEDWSILPQQYTMEEEAEVRENDEEREAISELSGGTGSHEPYFTDERGSKTYKTTCLKAIFRGETLSKDRLRKIRGMSSYGDTSASHNNLSDSVSVNGDPIIFCNGYSLANISAIKVSNKCVSSIDLSTNDLSSMETVEFTIRKLCTEEIDNIIYWNGQFDGQELIISGKKCLPIKANVELNPPNQMSKFYFDTQLIRGIVATKPTSYVIIFPQGYILDA